MIVEVTQAVTITGDSSSGGMNSGVNIKGSSSINCSQCCCPCHRGSHKDRLRLRYQRSKICERFLVL